MVADISSEYLGCEDTPLNQMLNSMFDGVYIVDMRRRIVVTQAPAGSAAGEASWTPQKPRTWPWLSRPAWD